MKSPVIHPFLFAIFPSLFLLTNNMDQFESSVAVGPILITGCLALLIWAMFSFALKSKTRAALIVSLCSFLLFSYEEFYEELRGLAITAGVSRIGARTGLLVVWGIFFALGTHLLVRTRRELPTLTQIVNAISLCLVAIPLVTIIGYEVKTRFDREGDVRPQTIVIGRAGLSQPTPLPDIYYIVVDGYARADILQEIYQHDGTEFLDYLDSKGVFVADRSRSNYGQTALSLASTLNLDYLDDLVDRIGAHYRSRGPLRKMVHNSEVFRFLKGYGYEIVVFSTAWSITDIRSADIYMAPRWSPDEFQTALIDMTPVPFIIDQLGGYGEYGLHRERILYTFDHLADFSQLEAPVFVLAHIMAPHPPFVFGPNGEEITPDYTFRLDDGDKLIVPRRLTRDEYVQGYREQLVFTTRRLRTALDSILLRSSEPPIIILQSDHGPGSLLHWEDPEQTYFKERLSILNAYYFPDSDYTDLYDGITPVNTFRLVFNKYFGANMELLEDKSYFSTWSRPYAFIDVTDDVTARLDTGRPE